MVARPGTRSAQVSLDGAGPDGDSPLTGYTVTPYIGATAQTAVDRSIRRRPAQTVTGLTNGTSYTFRVRATNAVGTGPQSSASAAVMPQATIFDFATPATVDSGDTDRARGRREVHEPTSTGQVTGIRFYKAAANTGTHVGSLWTAPGTRLAQATFTNESASRLADRDVRDARSTITRRHDVRRVVLRAATGHYSVAGGAFASAVSNPPLHALANGTSANGVYAYGAAEHVPDQHFNAAQLLGRRAVRAGGGARRQVPA